MGEIRQSRRVEEIPLRDRECDVDKFFKFYFSMNIFNAIMVNVTTVLRVLI